MKGNTRLIEIVCIIVMVGLLANLTEIRPLNTILAQQAPTVEATPESTFELILKPTPRPDLESNLDNDSAVLPEPQAILTTSTALTDSQGSLEITPSPTLVVPQITKSITVSPLLTDNLGAATEITLLNTVMVPLIIQSDSSRVISVMIQDHFGVPKVEGVTGSHHNLSHHGHDPAKIGQLERTRPRRRGDSPDASNQPAAGRTAGI